MIHLSAFDFHSVGDYEPVTPSPSPRLCLISCFSFPLPPLTHSHEDGYDAHTHTPTPCGLPLAHKVFICFTLLTPYQSQVIYKPLVDDDLIFNKTLIDQPSVNEEAIVKS